LLGHIVATVGTEVIVGTHYRNSFFGFHCFHCYLTTMTSDHIAAMTLDIIVYFDIVFALLSRKSDISPQFL
jgi:hypothetical protein